MRLTDRNRILLINLLAAIAVSMIVNFSYFVFMVMTPPAEGYVPRYMSWPGHFMLLQFLYNTILAFLLFCIFTVWLDEGTKPVVLTKRIVLAIAVSVFFYFISPRYSSRLQEITVTFNARRIFDPMQVLKSTFTFIVAVLYGIIYDLLYQKQKVVIENEVLKNENLKTTYNALMTQINPHFLFNSLNSLSMLVREQEKDKALEYIDRISDTYRYIIQNGHTGMTSLSHEMEFLNSYKYLHEIRYAGKLFFDIEIEPEYMDWTIPSLSLQPLIENAVKHNTITRSAPLHISIFTKNGWLFVSNPIRPRIEPGTSTGIGIMNLRARYKVLTNREIEVYKDDTLFYVSLPLTQPGK